MQGYLPEEQDEIRQRLIAGWIAGRPTVEGQVEGCAAVIAAFIDVFQPMLSRLAVNAIMARAAKQARGQTPLLANIVITPDGLDVERQKAELRGQSPDKVQEALAVLVSELFSVLYGLLGSNLTPFLRDVEAQVAAKDARPPADKEEQ